MGQIPHLNKLRESFHKKGLRIVAVSDEPIEKLEGFVASKGIQYAVGVSGRKDKAYGSGGIPHAYLIAPDGKVVWDGHPASLQDGMIEKHLRGTKDFYLRGVHSKLGGAKSAFLKGQMVKAEELAKAGLRDGDADVQADAQYILNRVEGYKKAWESQAKGAAESGDYDTVFDALAKLQKHFAGTEAAAAAAKRTAELKADPKVQQELKATKALGRLNKQLEKAGDSARKNKALVPRYEKFIKKYAGTKAAARAESILRSVRTAAMK